MDNSVKNPIRNLAKPINQKVNEYKVTSDLSTILFQFGHLSKALTDSVNIFLKRYLIISANLEEMKRDFIGEANGIVEYLNNTRKEIQGERYTQNNKMPISMDYTTNIKAHMSNTKVVSKIPRSTKDKADSANRREILPSHGSVNSKAMHTSANVREKGRNNKDSMAKSPHTLKSNNDKKDKVITHKKNTTASLRKPYADKIENDKDMFVKGQRSFSWGLLDVAHSNNTNTLPKDTEITNHNSIAFNDINDPFMKVTNLVSNSQLLSLNERFKICNLNNSQGNDNPTSKSTNKALSDYNSQSLKQKIIDLEELKESYTKEEENDVMQLCSYPSKTAQSGLHFLTKEKEEEIMKDEVKDNEELLGLISACLSKEISYETIAEAYNQLFKLFNVNSIKSLFIDVIYPKIFKNRLDELSKEKTVILEILSTNKEIIKNNIKAKVNPSLSCITFSLDEIYQHLRNLNSANEETILKAKNELELRSLKKQYDQLLNTSS